MSDSVTVTYPPEDIIESQVVIRDCGRLIVDTIVNQFKVGAWKHNVTLTVDKTKPGWLDTSVSLRLSWRGPRSAVEAYTQAAKRYLDKVSRP